MGFCSGTEIFDDVARHIIDTDWSEQQQSDVLIVLIVALDNHDWDCHQDSAYYDHPIIQKAMKAVHPDRVEDEEQE